MHVSYLSQSLRRQDRMDTINWVIGQIRANKIKFDGFLVTGLSGAIIGSILAHRLRKALVVVRKGEDSHSSHEVEVGPTPSGKTPTSLLFLDDLIASGETVTRVADIIKRNPACPTNVVAALLYYDGNTYTKDKFSELNNRYTDHVAVKKLLALN